MRKITVAANSLVLLLCWSAGFVAIAPAYNHFVLYTPDGGVLPLPVLTEFIFSVRFVSLIVPMVWLFGSILFSHWAGRKEMAQRSDLVQLHTSLSVLVGLSLFVLFLTAGVLPYLKIGALFD